MFGRSFLADPGIAGAIARFVHSRWLTEALRSPKKYPRIPIRKVSEGGFDDLMSSPEGRLLANAWWSRALNQVDDLP